MTDQSFETMRRAMVSSQLRTTAVNDARVVAVMGDVARERFVPAGQNALAYLDRAVPLGGGRALPAPMVTGRLLTEAQVRSTDTVLVVGAATGYAAALLARLAGKVIALEEDGSLLDQARTALAGSGVEIVEGPLAAGWSSGAPYDLILIDGAVEQIPHALIDQLADGGRLAAALVDRGVTRLAIGRKGGTGFGSTAFADAEAPVLPGFAHPREFSF